MTDRPDGGGSAFPEWQTPEDDNSAPRYEKGMLLWDYYAAAALTGMGVPVSFDAERGQDMRIAAEAAADMADSMLAERRRRFKDTGQ